MMAPLRLKDNIFHSKEEPPRQGIYFLGALSNWNPPDGELQYRHTSGGCWLKIPFIIEHLFISRFQSVFVDHNNRAKHNLPSTCGLDGPPLLYRSKIILITKRPSNDGARSKYLYFSPL